MRRIFRLSFVVALFAILLGAPQAHAIPSFSAQTGQPCSACHVGAFGPQLKPYGRDFKLGGYVSSDRPNDDLADNWYERVSVMAKSSFTHTEQNQDPSTLPTGFGKNDNFAFDQAAVYFGGRITPTIGAIQEVSYDGVNGKFFWDALDVRHAWDGTLFGTDYTAGVEVGNQLGNTSVWNSTTPNNFPYNQSGVAPTPAGTLFDDSLNGQILGPGAYFSNGWIYAEGAAYFPLSMNMQQAVGNTATDKYVAPIPFWHMALEHDFDHHYHYAQIGTFGAVASRQPGADQTTGLTDNLSDLGFEANYQYLADPHNVFSAHAAFIHENQDLKASQALGNSANQSDRLNSFKVDATYAIDDTYVPTLQYFRTVGTPDTTLYTGNGKPNSEGYTIDLAYVPFGKPDSPAATWANMRLALQYTGYTEFDGTSKGAAGNNTIFLNLWLIGSPLVPVFGGSQ
jgi:hypothetical protein